MSSLFLSRARLRNDGATSALKPLFVPDDEDERIATGHRLMWSLFADGPDRQRDFLWRERESGGHSFMALSARPPVDSHHLFELETKEFMPHLSSGDRLGFVLRANATTTSAKRLARGQRGERIDVVMAALAPLAKGEARSRARDEIVEREGRAWLVRQGVSAGFSVDPEEVSVSSYRVRRLPRRKTNGHGRPAAVTIGVLDLEGVLTVTEPVAFLAAVATGFGRSKAFGCGLMLVRRLVG